MPWPAALALLKEQGCLECRARDELTDESWPYHGHMYLNGDTISIIYENESDSESEKELEKLEGEWGLWYSDTTADAAPATIKPKPPLTIQHPTRGGSV